MKSPLQLFICSLTGFLLLVGEVARAEETLIKAAKVYTNNGKSITPGRILVKDGKITAVSADLEAKEGQKVIDRGDSVIVPGSVNAYSQIGVDGGASEFTREITPDLELQSSINWGSRAFREALASGSTSICVSPGGDNVIAGAALVVKTAGAAGKRVVNRDAGVVVTVASDPRSRNSSRRRPDSIYVRQPTNRMGVVWLLRSTLDRVKRSPMAEDQRLVEVLKGKRKVFSLTRTHYDINALLRVSDEFGIKPTILGGQEAYKHADDLAKRKVGVILGPLTTSTDSGPEGADPVWNHASSLHKAGVVFAFSGPDLLEQARFAVRFGLPPQAAMHAITSAPAKLLGVGNRVGSIAPGRDADLVILSGDPFEFTTRVQAVVVDGVVYEEGTDL